jgi:thiol:disulfide interchange protein
MCQALKSLNKFGLDGKMKQKLFVLMRLVVCGVAGFVTAGCVASMLPVAEPALSVLQPKLLDANVAFRFAARLKDAQTIEVRYQIANGYYVYKDKFRATVRASEQPSLTALALILPAGTVVDDPGFGKVETYGQVVFFDVPLNETVKNTGVQLTLYAQGCADVGVCYAPLRHSISLSSIGDFVSITPPALGGASSLSAPLSPPSLAQ